MYPGFVALKACVLQQGHVVWVGDVFRLGYLLVMGFAWIGLAQKGNSLFLDGGNHDILITMDFLLATIVQSLFFRIFGSLTPPCGTVNDGIRLFLTLLTLLELFRVAFRFIPKVVQDLFQNRQQRMDPFVGSRLADRKQFAHNRLHRETLLVH